MTMQASMSRKRHHTNTTQTQTQTDNYRMSNKRFLLVMTFKLLFLSHLDILVEPFCLQLVFFSSAGRVTWNEDVDEVKEERRREGSWDILDHPDPILDNPDLRNNTNDKIGLTAAVTQLDDALDSLNIQNADLGTK